VGTSLQRLQRASYHEIKEFSMSFTLVALAACSLAQTPQFWPCTSQLGSDGYYTFPMPTDDSLCRIVFVDPARGTDPAPGAPNIENWRYTPSEINALWPTCHHGTGTTVDPRLIGDCVQAFATPQAAIQHLRDNKADRLYIRRGSEIRGRWLQTPSTIFEIGGYCETSPMIIGAYGPDNDGRPVMTVDASTNGEWANIQGDDKSYLVIESLDIYADRRDPNNMLNFTTNAAVGGSNSSPVAIKYCSGSSEAFMMQDVRIRYFTGGIAVSGGCIPQGAPVCTSKTKFITLHRCTVGFCYNSDPGGDSSGAFIAGGENILVTETLLHNNGWCVTSPINSPGTARNQNLYASQGSRIFRVENSVSSMPSHGGFQMRANEDNLLTDSLALECPIAVSGGHQQSLYPCFTSYGNLHKIDLRHNVVLGGRNVAGDPRGWGLKIGRVHQSTVADNIVAYGDGGNSRRGILIDWEQRSTDCQYLSGTCEECSTLCNPQTASHAVSVRDNIVYNWLENPGNASGVSGASFTMEPYNVHINCAATPVPCNTNPVRTQGTPVPTAYPNWLNVAGNRFYEQTQSATNASLHLFTSGLPSSAQFVYPVAQPNIVNNNKWFSNVGKNSLRIASVGTCGERNFDALIGTFASNNLPCAGRVIDTATNTWQATNNSYPNATMLKYLNSPAVNAGLPNTTSPHDAYIYFVFQGLENRRGAWNVNWTARKVNEYMRTNMGFAAGRIVSTSTVPARGNYCTCTP
jgi:hypothetical protein